MTVLNQNSPFSQHIGDGVTEFFLYGFEVKSYSDILVDVDGVPTNFVRGDTGVTITPAPADGAVIDIKRSTSLDQLVDFTAQEAFKPDKTEDALDKLILLKQEAVLNLGIMNLLSQPFLDNVTLVNDVGTDAVIPIWNVNAGVFSGEVNTVIPAAGQVVAKPEDFVYMQYGDIGETMTLTTTIYPIESPEALAMSIALDEAVMSPISEDAVDTSNAFLGAVMVETLISTDPIDDAVDTSNAFLGAVMNQTLISGGPYDDAVDTDNAFLGAVMEDKLVQVYAPDEALQMSIALAEATMTPV